MKGEQFYAGEEPLVENLENLQSSKDQAIVERTMDLRSPGIISNPGWMLADGVRIPVSTSFELTLNGLTAVNVGYGVAYDLAGERIIIADTLAYNALNPSQTDSEGVPTPQSTGSQAVPLNTTAGVVNTIYIQYLAALDPTQFTVDPDLGIKQYTQKKDGYKILPLISTDTPPTGALLLGTVTIDSLGQPLTPSITGQTPSLQVPQSVSIVTPAATQVGPIPPSLDYPGQTLTLQDHINAVGTGGVVSATNPHGVGIDDIPGLTSALNAQAPLVQPTQRDSHVPGIIYEEEASNTLLADKPGLYPGSGTPPASPTISPTDQALKVIRINPLDSSGDEVLYLNGYRLTADTAFVNDYARGELGQAIPHVGFYPQVAEFTPAPIGTYHILATFSQNITQQVVIHFTRRLVSEAVLSSSEYIIATVDWDGTVLGGVTFTDDRTFGLTASKNLQVDLTDTFTVAHNVAITKKLGVNGVNYTWPSTQGSSGTVLTNNGTGTLSWSQSSMHFLTFSCGGYSFNYVTLTLAAFDPPLPAGTTIIPLITVDFVAGYSLAPGGAASVFGFAQAPGPIFNGTNPETGVYRNVHVGDQIGAYIAYNAPGGGSYSGTARVTAYLAG